MIQIKLICVGKIKEKYLREGIQEYSKRMSNYAKLDIIEVDEEKIQNEVNDKEITRIIDIEGKRILEKIPANAHVVTLEIQKRLFSSEDLAEYITNVSTYQTSQLFFVIGGSYGLSEFVKARANQAISFSKMTFPHQLMRLIFLEQIYRCFTIMNHITYHK